MSNLFDTGSEHVDRMIRLQFTGNVIPLTWYHTIKKGTGKSKLNASSYWQILCTGTGLWKSGMSLRGNCVALRKNSRPIFCKEIISSWPTSLE